MVINNQRGGILSKLFIIPVGVALMAGFFFLGYFIGRYQSTTAKMSEQLAPLPEIVADHLPKKEDFTFYKALTEKDNVTISIDLKPKEQQKQAAGDTGKEQTSVPKEPGPQKVPPPAETQKKQERTIEVKLDKPSSSTAKAPAAAGTKAPPPPGSADGQLRYTVQIASYPEREMAEEEVRRMKKRGYAAFVAANEIPERGTWYRVRVGSFKNRLSAEKLMQELKNKEGLSPFITIE